MYHRNLHHRLYIRSRGESWQLNLILLSHNQEPSQKIKIKIKNKILAYTNSSGSSCANKDVKKFIEKKERNFFIKKLINMSRL